MAFARIDTCCVAPPVTTTPLPPNCVMLKPRSRLLLALKVKPLVAAGAALPAMAMTGAAAQPGCVWPSMTKGAESVMPATGAMLATPALK